MACFCGNMKILTKPRTYLSSKLSFDIFVNFIILKE